MIALWDGELCYGPRAISVWPPVFVVTLEHTQALTHLCVVSGFFCTTVVELSSYDRNYMTHKSQNTYNLALHRKGLPTPILRSLTQSWCLSPTG